MNSIRRLAGVAERARRPRRAQPGAVAAAGEAGRVDTRGVEGLLELSWSWWLNAVLAGVVTPWPQWPASSRSS